jgi:hypothetical protein
MSVLIKLANERGVSLPETGFWWQEADENAGVVAASVKLTAKTWRETGKGMD